MSFPTHTHTPQRSAGLRRLCLNHAHFFMRGPVQPGKVENPCRPPPTGFVIPRPHFYTRGCASAQSSCLACRNVIVANTEYCLTCEKEAKSELCRACLVSRLLFGKDQSTRWN